MKKDLRYTNDDVLTLVEMLISEAQDKNSEWTTNLRKLETKLRRSEFRDYEQTLKASIGEIRRRAIHRIEKKHANDLRDFIYQTSFEELPLWVSYEGSFTTKKEIGFLIKWRLKIGK